MNSRSRETTGRFAPNLGSASVDGAGGAVAVLRSRRACPPPLPVLWPTKVCPQLLFRRARNLPRAGIARQPIQCQEGEQIRDLLRLELLLDPFRLQRHLANV